MILKVSNPPEKQSGFEEVEGVKEHVDAESDALTTEELQQLTCGQTCWISRRRWRRKQTDKGSSTTTT